MTLLLPVLVEDFMEVPELFLDTNYLIPQVRKAVEVLTQLTESIDSLFKVFQPCLESRDANLPSIGKGSTVLIELLRDRLVTAL